MKSITDQQNQEQGKVIKVGFDQISNPTPTAAKIIFRVVLYISALWAVAAPIITEIPAPTLAMINKYLLLLTTLVNVTIQFFGWDFQNGSAKQDFYKSKSVTMRSFFFLLFILAGMIASSQSAFKALPKHTTHGKYGVSVSSPTVTSAFRFTGPIAGFAYPQNQVVTGLGYGWQKLHWIDSTSKYYADFSLSAVVYAGGNVQPSLNDNNILSVGLSLGVLNQLIMIGPVYNFPKGENKGSFGVVVNFSVPLNN